MLRRRDPGQGSLRAASSPLRVAAVVCGPPPPPWLPSAAHTACALSAHISTATCSEPPAISGIIQVVLTTAESSIKAALKEIGGLTKERPSKETSKKEQTAMRQGSQQTAVLLIRCDGGQHTLLKRASTWLDGRFSSLSIVDTSLC